MKSFAKINLGLKITGKRADGYHELETIFQEISLYDEINVGITDGDIRLTCDDASLPRGDSNLMVRAAKKMLHYAKITGGVTLELRKKIPVAAGLGGGSSNAAAVIREIDRLFGLGWRSLRLKEIAAELGADVPFFIDGGGMLGRGIGDILTPLEIPPFWAVLIYPGIFISTADVYRKTNLLLTSKTDCIRIATVYARKKDLSGMLSSLTNDMETVVCPAYPEITKIKERLLKGGALCALMSGSGSSVYGIFTSRGECEAVLPNLSGMDSRARVFIVSSRVEDGFREYPSGGIDPL